MSVWSDIRVSVRSLLKNPAFTAAAVLTVAIGVGSATAIATIVGSILLRPLPYRDSDRIAQIISYRQEGAATVRALSMAGHYVVGLGERSRSFADIGAFDSFSNIAGAGALHMSLGGLPAAPESEPLIMRIVTRGYFDAMGMRIMGGRSFSETGGAAYPELVVNQEFARRHVAGTNPLGQLLGDPTRYQIVGVVNDVRHSSLTAGVQAEYYVDLTRFGLTEAVRPHVVVRSAAGRGALGSLIQSAVRGVDPQLGVDLNQQTIAELVSASVARPRFNTWVLGGFAMVALALAAVGIYGVMAHAVTRRTREIGIRMAIGAAPPRVLAAVLRQSLTLTSMGAALGLLGAAAVSRYLESMLFELTPLDPSTFAAVAMLFLLVALVSAYLPAARASRVDPLVALRHD